MDKVFVSYSHADSEFADRLVSDLRLSDIPATYDRWVLNVGDSIIAKIAEEVSAADRVIALLSRASVSSNWVRKELALAMTGELASVDVKVLPALIEDCTVPDMLLDKFYADFRHEYYTGMRALTKALLPDGLRYDRANQRLQDLEKIEVAKMQYSQLLQSGDKDAIHGWLLNNNVVLAGLLGHVWASFGIISHLDVHTEKMDFAVITGQSGRFDISLVYLGELNCKREGGIQKEVGRLIETIRWARANLKALQDHFVMRTVNDPSFRPASSYGSVRHLASARHINLNIKAFIGRRSEYGSEENTFRNQIYNATEHGIDIISYDRVVDILDHIPRRG